MSSDLVLLIKFGAFTVFAVWMAIIADLLILPAALRLWDYENCSTELLNLSARLLAIKLIAVYVSCKTRHVSIIQRVELWYTLTTFI